MRRSHDDTREQIFGTELIMDLDGCEAALISDADTLTRYTTELVEQIDMKAYGDAWRHHFGHADPITSGYTVFQPIETSSIVIHVSENLRRVHINVFSCRPFDTEEALEFSERFFASTRTTCSVLRR